MSVLVTTVGSVVAAVATPLVISMLSGAIGKGRPASLAQGTGTISPEKISAALTVAVGAAFVVGGVAALAAGLLPMAAISLVLGACLAGFMAPSLTHVHDVSWDMEGIEGPSKLFGPTLGLKRDRIVWSDIATTGTTTTSYWFVETVDGRRVYWSYLYKGYGALLEALEKHRPGLLQVEEKPA
jgi:hypothetical protein